MREGSRWMVGGSLVALAFAACGTHKAGPLAASGDDSGTSGGDDGAASSGGGTFNSDAMLNLQTGSSGGMSANSNCRGGHYSGNFTGSYTSHLTGIGFPIPVAGNVELDLYQEGSAMQTCMLNGEALSCNNVFSLRNGTITGVADAIWVADAAIGGFPYFCVMTGTLDCMHAVLVNGWIQCTYCTGPLADGGMSCATGVGGNFAGPLTAGYDTTHFGFTNGTWNGAEALAGNNGMMPGPDGGSIWNYLSDSGMYLGPGDFGGSGTWNAVWQ